MFLIGSRAVPPLWRAVKTDADWDIVLEGCETVSMPLDNSEGVDICLSQSSDFDENTFEVCREYYVMSRYEETPLGPARPINPIGAMLLKRSHLHRPEKFGMHIRDYHAAFSIHGKETLNPRYRALLWDRTRLTKKHFGDRTPSLAMSAAAFFDDGVKKIYRHDDIHNVVAYGAEPVFRNFQTPGSEVMCDLSLWNRLTHADRVNAVREETFVIAIERKLAVPGNEWLSPRHAFAWALMRVCTTLTSGYFRDFAIDNWPEIRDYGTYDFWGKFKANIPERIDR